MLEILKCYYPVLFVVFFFVMELVIIYKSPKIEEHLCKNDTTRIDKYMNANFRGVSEVEILDRMKDVEFEYRGW